jgi:hypothetical protein
MESSYRDRCLVVFAQRAQPLLEIDAWNQHGERFFDTRIGVAEPLESGARLVIAPAGHDPGLRRVEGRARSDEDLAEADAAEARAQGAGLALLARRCQSVWLVEKLGEADSLALRLAAVMASVLLGPILDGAAGELFGVKTARAKISQITKS